MCAHFDAAGRLQRTGTVGGLISLTDLDGLDDAVPVEVAAGDQPEYVLAVFVRAGDPA